MFMKQKGSQCDQKNKMVGRVRDKDTEETGKATARIQVARENSDQGRWPLSWYKKV